MRLRTCVVWTLFGIMLGLAATAYGQDGSMPLPLPIPTAPTTGDPLADAIVKVITGTSLPGLLGLVFYLQSRNGGIPLVVSLSADDRKRVDRLTKVLASFKKPRTNLADIDSSDEPTES